ncbi:unnamed protein product [Discula destructiva]
MKCTYVALIPTLASLATGLSLPSQHTKKDCSNAVAGLTAWSEANFSGTKYQYNVAWNICVSMAGQFPYNQPNGVSSIAANADNWCTVYPNTVCDPGQGRANDTLYLIGSYYDLAGSEEMWDDYPQSFSCRSYNC